ncbi:MAG: hypothetical protein WCS65_13430 [Verrucomicrobiae bacterium]
MRAAGRVSQAGRSVLGNLAALVVLFALVLAGGFLFFRQPDPTPPLAEHVSRPSASAASSTAASGPASPNATPATASVPPVVLPAASATDRTAAVPREGASSPATGDAPDPASNTPLPSGPPAKVSGTAVASGGTTSSPGADVSGVPAKATVVVAGKEYSFAPNSQGLFPRVPMGLQETVTVAVAYPEGAAGDLVTIQSEDGGSLAGGETVVQATLDDNRQVRFPFKSTQEGGIYRVTLRKGFDEKRLEFWGGTEPLVQSANP